MLVSSFIGVLKIVLHRDVEKYVYNLKNAYRSSDSDLVCLLMALPLSLVIGAMWVHLTGQGSAD